MYGGHMVGSIVLMTAGFVHLTNLIHLLGQLDRSSTVSIDGDRAICERRYENGQLTVGPAIGRVSLDGAKCQTEWDIDFTPPRSQ